MRAALIDAATGIDTIRVGEAPIGAPGAGEIQIDVRASSVNFPDILMSEGAYQIKENGVGHAARSVFVKAGTTASVDLTPSHGGNDK